ncbi:MAG: CBS domain-containing protein [Candidatus Bathyarchaeota archaeon]
MAKLDKALDIAYTKYMYNLNIHAPLSDAIIAFTSEPQVYRLTVVDDEMHVKGCLSAMKILDLLIKKVCDITEAEGERSLTKFLAEPVLLFHDECLHRLSENIALKGALEYIIHNRAEHISLVDSLNVLRGILTDGKVLNRLPFEKYGIHISHIMTPNAITTSLHESIKTAVAKMSMHQIKHLLIMDEDSVQGLVCVMELFNIIVRRKDSFKLVLDLCQEPLKNFKRKEIATFLPEEDVGAVIKKFREEFVHAVAIVSSEDKLLGIVTTKDIITKLPDILGLDTFTKLLNVNSAS